MTTCTATDAKNNFGRLLDRAQRHPITITKQKRKVAVLLSAEEYAALQEIKEREEDAYWVEVLRNTPGAHTFIGAAKSRKLMRDIFSHF